MELLPAKQLLRFTNRLRSSAVKLAVGSKLLAQSPPSTVNVAQESVMSGAAIIANRSNGRTTNKAAEMAECARLHNSSIAGVGRDAAGEVMCKAEHGLRYQPRSRVATLNSPKGCNRRTGGKHDEADIAERRHGLRDPHSVVMTVLSVTTKFGNVYTVIVTLGS